MLTWPHSGFHGHTAVWHGALGPRGRSRVRHPPRALLRPESRRAGAADLRARRQGGDVPVGQVRGPDGRHRDRRPARVPGPGAGAHPRQGPRHHAVLWLVCQPPPWHAGQGGARRGRATRHHPRAPTRANRGQSPMGGPPPTDFRGRPAGLSDLPWAHAGCCVHHAGLGDQPDPRASPCSPCAGGPCRRAEPPSTRAPATPGPSRAACPSADARTPP